MTKRAARPAVTNLGQMIRTYRAVHDLDLRTFGSFVGLSAPSVMRIEQGRSFDVETWMKIQSFLMDTNKVRES